MRMNQPKLISIDHFNVTGLSVRTSNREEFNPETATLPELWQRFYSEDLANKIPNRISDSPIFGVYSNYESNADGLYTLTAGVKSKDQPSTPAFCSIPVLAGDYLVFENKGMMPHVVIDTWLIIWNYFKSQQHITRRYETDFEVYQNDEDIAIYIGVKQPNVV